MPSSLPEPNAHGEEWQGREERLRAEITQAVKDGDALLRELLAWRLAESIMARTLGGRLH